MVVQHRGYSTRNFAYRLLVSALVEPPAPGGAAAPVEITSSFPDNPFSLITNGQQNKLQVTFDNKGTEAYTIDVVSGAFFDTDFTQVVRNLTAFKYGVPVPAMDHIDVPYSFYSEFKPQELGLLIIVDFSDEAKNRFRGVAYNGTVSIVEPAQSLLDPQLLFLYVLLAGMLVGAGYLIKQAFFPDSPQARRQKKNKAKKVVEEKVQLAPGGYDESWIPEHHLKKPKVTKRKPSRKSGATSATSGEE